MSGPYIGDRPISDIVAGTRSETPPRMKPSQHRCPSCRATLCMELDEETRRIEIVAYCPPVTDVDSAIFHQVVGVNAKGLTYDTVKLGDKTYEVKLIPREPSDVVKKRLRSEHHRQASSLGGGTAQELIERALNEPDLADALAVVGIWEVERAVGQAKRFLETGERTGADGRGWDTLFSYLFRRILQAHKDGGRP